MVCASRREIFTGVGGAKAGLGLEWKFLRGKFVVFDLVGFGIGFSVLFNYDESFGKLVGAVGSCFGFLHYYSMWYVRLLSPQFTKQIRPHCSLTIDSIVTNYISSLVIISP
jgi:hypothetical protein